jgi:hypothetical protein
MDERRGLERFDIGLHSRIIIQDDSGNREKASMELTTINISSGGAFFHMDRPISEGTKVLVEIVLPLERLKRQRESMPA